MTDWSLTIEPAEDDGRPGLHGFRATCSCGYRSRLQTAPEAFRNVAMAAAQHLEYAHSRKLSDPAYDSVGVEVAETKNEGWAWRCHLCDEQEFHLLDEETARSRAGDHGRQYRHHRKAAS